MPKDTHRYIRLCLYVLSMYFLKLILAFTIDFAQPHIHMYVVINCYIYVLTVKIAYVCLYVVV